MLTWIDYMAYVFILGFEPNIDNDMCQEFIGLKNHEIIIIIRYYIKY